MSHYYVNSIQVTPEDTLEFVSHGMFKEKHQAITKAIDLMVGTWTSTPYGPASIAYRDRTRTITVSWAPPTYEGN